MPKVGKFSTMFCGKHTDFPINYSTANLEFVVELHRQWC